MQRTNWRLVFLGGLLAGIVMNILGFLALEIYLRKLWNPALEALNPTFQETIGFQIFWAVLYLISGILAVWLYSAIRPRYGSGPKTAFLAGFMFWVLSGLSFAVVLGSLGLFPVNLLVIDSLTYLVMLVVATLLGASIYQETFP
jgi:hypothetical protein